MYLLLPEFICNLQQHFPSLAFVVLKERLRQRGTLTDIKARIRAEVLAALDDKPTERKDVPVENVVINELIREYLVFNGYLRTVSVFLPEARLSSTSDFDRDFLAKECGVVPAVQNEVENKPPLPLLYNMRDELVRRRRIDRE